MKRQSLLLPLLAIAPVLALAWFAATRQSHPDHPPGPVVSNSPAPVVSIQPAPPPILPPDFLPRYLSAIRSRSGLAGPLPPGEAEDLSVSLESFGPGQLRAVIAALLAAPNLSDRLIVSNLAWNLQLLAQHDPQSALSLFDEIAPRFTAEDQRIIAAAMLPYAASDAPESAAAWWLQHARDLGESTAGRLRVQILTWVALRHPDRAFSLIEKLQITDLQSAGNGIGKAATTSPSWTATLAAMRTYLAGLKDPAPAGQLREGVMAGLSESLLQQPFSDVLAWIESASLNPAEQKSLAEGIEPYDSGALPTPDDQEMARWLDWIVLRISPDHLSTKVEALVTSWARWFPAAAERWIAASTELPVKEAAIRGFVKQIAPASPDDAARVAMLLPDGPPRTGILQIVADARTLKYGYLEERPGE